MTDPSPNVSPKKTRSCGTVLLWGALIFVALIVLAFGVCYQMAKNF